VKCDLDSEQASVNMAGRATPISRDALASHGRHARITFFPLRQAFRFRDDNAAHRFPFAQASRNSTTLATATVACGHLVSEHGSRFCPIKPQVAHTRLGNSKRFATGGPVVALTACARGARGAPDAGRLRRRRPAARDARSR
jgi:hypothetical protein